MGKMKSLKVKIASNQSGTTLIELILTLVLTLLVVSVVPPLLMVTNTANTTSQQLSYGTNSASIGIETIDNYVASATYVCIPSGILPTNQGSYIAQSSGSSGGYALLAESDAFNGPQNPEWVEFIIPKSTSQSPSDKILYWRHWSANSGTNTTQPPSNTEFSPLVQPVYNYQQNQAPFKLITSSNGAESVAINLYVGSTTKAPVSSNGLPANIVNMTNVVAALDTGTQSASTSTTTTSAGSTSTSC